MIEIARILGMMSGEGKRLNEEVGQQSPGNKRIYHFVESVLRKCRDPREGKHEVKRAFISFSYVYVYHACLIVEHLLVLVFSCQATMRKSGTIRGHHNTPPHAT